VVALACVAVLAFTPAKASATPVLWNLNASISNGVSGVVGTASGSFVFDADTNLFSSVAITTTLPAATFSTSEIGGAFASPPPGGLQLIDNFVPGPNLGKATISLNFSSPLTNLGGSVGVDGNSSAGFCASNACDLIQTGHLVGGAVVIDGGLVTGQVVGTPVAAAPEPATLLLCSAGLIGVRRWRQRRA
jgi:hypothetical protein